MSSLEKTNSLLVQYKAELKSLRLETNRLKSLKKDYSVVIKSMKGFSSKLDMFFIKHESKLQKQIKITKDREDRINKSKPGRRRVSIDKNALFNYITFKN